MLPVIAVYLQDRRCVGTTFLFAQDHETGTDPGTVGDDHVQLPVLPGF